MGDLGRLADPSSRVRSQIERGLIRCPVSRRALRIHADGADLETHDGQHRYPLWRGQVPFLTVNSSVSGADSREVGPPESGHRPQAAGPPHEDASASRGSEWPGLKGWIKGTFARLDAGGYRSEGSSAAFAALFEGLSDDAVVLSVGGGPNREHPTLTTLNISPAEDVDIVGDAHNLPYVDGGVDGVFCESVLEHLEDPHSAVREMFRVLRPGGQVVAVTPFFMGYHGYPDHFQNFTLTGHVRLFTRAGFEVLESGPCVGPIRAVSDAVFYCLRFYVPFSAPIAAFWWVFCLLIRPLDKWLMGHPYAFRYTSSTFVQARKPAAIPGQDVLEAD